jgi:hypothetical protein
MSCCLYNEINKVSRQFISVPLLGGFINSIVSFICPYSCCWFNICSAYAEWGLFVLLYIKFSRKQNWVC